MAAYYMENAVMNQLVGRGDARCCNVCIEVGGEKTSKGNFFESNRQLKENYFRN